MEINDFQFSFRQLNPVTFETIITSKEGVKFGCNYQSRQPAPPEFIWNEFNKNKSNFFIDVQSEIIPDKPIEVIVENNSPPIEIKS